jgi:hypothetical protein
MIALIEMGGRSDEMDEFDGYGVAKRVCSFEEAANEWTPDRSHIHVHQPYLRADKSNFKVVQSWIQCMGTHPCVRKFEFKTKVKSQPGKREHIQSKSRRKPPGINKLTRSTS